MFGQVSSILHGAVADDIASCLAVVTACLGFGSYIMSAKASRQQELRERDVQRASEQRERQRDQYNLQLDRFRRVMSESLRPLTCAMQSVE